MDTDALHSNRCLEIEAWVDYLNEKGWAIFEKGIYCKKCKPPNSSKVYYSYFEEEVEDIELQYVYTECWKCGEDWIEKILPYTLLEEASEHF